MPRKEDDEQDNWDDTQLVKVWEDCLAEYKKYHSIAVNGGTEQDIELLVAEQQAADEEDYRPQDDPAEADLNAPTAVDNVKPTAAEERKRHEHLPEINGAVHEPSAMSMQPPPLPNKMQENMKALALSWYYAGYYAGRADAQSQIQEGGSG